MKRFWSGKVLGIPHAFILIVSAGLNKIFSRIHTIVVTNNLSECGNNVTISRGVKLNRPGNIRIGSYVHIGNKTVLNAGEIPSGKIYIENGVSIDKDCYIDYSGDIVLRKDSHIAWGVYISTHSHGYDYKAKPKGSSLEICEHAFIGAKSIILSQCNYIGKYSVIGTGSVVTKDVPDYAVVAGNPARIIKMLENQ